MNGEGSMGSRRILIIGFGHPLFGLGSACIGGGQGAAVIVEAF